MTTLIGTDLKQFRSYDAVKAGPVKSRVTVMHFTRKGRHQSDGIRFAFGQAKNGRRKRVILNGQGRSMAMAVPSPPPIQIAATPRFKSRFSKAFSKVTMMRAPDAPIG